MRSIVNSSKGRGGDRDGLRGGDGRTTARDGKRGPSAALGGDSDGLRGGDLEGMCEGVMRSGRISSLGLLLRSDIFGGSGKMEGGWEWGFNTGGGEGVWGGAGAYLWRGKGGRGTLYLMRET